MDIGDIKYLQAPAKTITKLSEAIRIGSKLRPQGRGLFFESGKSCAIGAAMEAIGVPYTERLFYVPDDFVRQFPYATKSKSEFGNIGFEIIRMNDSRNYTREQIADWLEEQGY